MTSILLIAELDDRGDISQSTLQAITAAKSLTDADITVAVAADSAGSFSTLAVDKVVMISAVSAADDGIFERVTDNVAALVTSISPDVVILSKTDVGSVIGARLVVLPIEVVYM